MPIFLAVLQELHQDCNFEYSSLNFVNISAQSHIVPVSKIHGSSAAQEVVPSSIKGVCVWMDVGLDIACLGLLPNVHEKD